MGTEKISWILTVLLIKLLSKFPSHFSTTQSHPSLLLLTFTVVKEDGNINFVHSLIIYSEFSILLQQLKAYIGSLSKKGRKRENMHY